MLVIEKLHFDYNGQNILEGVNIEAPKGDLTGIVGPNGSGKTTLFRIISGVLKPASGKIIACGTNMSTVNTKEKARIVSIVPQNPTLPPNYTVRDLVLMSRNPHLKLLEQESHLDFEIAEHSMELTEINHLSKRRVGTLSGGERQRAMLAMALTQQTPILLMDEPTANLDLIHQTHIMNLVSKIQKDDGRTILMAIHDLTLASQYCNRLIMISNGKDFTTGSPKEVLTSDNILTVYGAKVLVLPHPNNDGLIVTPISDNRIDPCDL